VSLFRPREGQQQEKEKPQKKTAPIGYEKSEDVGQVESNALNRPTVCLSKKLFFGKRPALE
jgi:hypothetical protein